MSAPSSTQKRLLERYWLEGDNLRMALTVEDPIFLLGLRRRSFASAKLPTRP